PGGPTWHRPINSPSIRRVAPPIAVGPARLFEQPDLVDLHCPIYGLHHVVDRQQRHGYSRERLHLHTGAPDRLRGGAHPHSRQPVVERRLDLYVIETQRMAERDELRRSLCRQGARHLAHRQDVALGDLLVRDASERLARHPDRPLGDRRAHRGGLPGDVHHPRAAGLVHMRQFHAVSPPAKTPANTAARSCGFTFPCARPRASSTRAIAVTTVLVSRPARACSRKRSSNPSSIPVNPPRAWNGCCASAKASRGTGPPSTDCRNRPAKDPSASRRSLSARSLPGLP